jgi:hypothetical protein
LKNVIEDKKNPERCETYRPGKRLIHPHELFIEH